MEKKIYDKLRRQDRLQVSRRMSKKKLQSTSFIEEEGENIDSIFDILPNNSIVTIVTKLGYCDFEVVLNDNYIIACHQKIINKFEYFGALQNFSEHNFRECKIEYKEVTINDFKTIFKFLYTKEINLNFNNIKSIYGCSNYLGIQSLNKKCKKFLKKSIEIEKVNEWIRYADENMIIELKLMLKALVNAPKFESLTKNKSLLMWSFDEFKTLVKSSRIVVTSEWKVLKNVLQWINYDPKNRSVHSKDLLNVVRFYYITENQIKLCFENKEKAETFKEVYSAYKITENENKIKCKPRIYFKGVYLIERYGFRNNGTRLKRHSPNDEIIECLAPPRDYIFGSEFVIVKDKIYHIGERYSQMYDPKKNTWCEIASTNIRRYEFGCVVYNEEIYVFGGTNSLDDQLFPVEKYNPETNIWTSLEVSMRRKNIKAVVVRNKIIFCGFSVLGEVLFLKEYMVNTKSIAYRPCSSSIPDTPNTFAFRDKVWFCSQYTLNSTSDVDCIVLDTRNYSYLSVPFTIPSKYRSSFKITFIKMTVYINNVIAAIRFFDSDKSGIFLIKYSIDYNSGQLNYMPSKTELFSSGSDAGILNKFDVIANY